MKKFLLPEGNKFYKANLHVHTDISDGKITPEEAKEGYKSHGYSVLAYTDHEVYVPHNDLCDDDFIAINAVELAINDNWPGGFKFNKTYHLNLYSKNQNQEECCVSTGQLIWLEHSKAYVSEKTLNNPYRKFHSIVGINDLIKRANDEGFMVCYNHPVWSMHDYRDYSGLKGLWGVEVYNTGSARGGYEDTVQPYEDLIRENQRLVPVASDDAHALNANAYGGWTMIAAESLNYESVISALEKGDCYSSTGPEIKELYIEDGVVHVSTSDVVFVKLVTNIRITKVARGTQDKPLCDAALDINDYFALIDGFKGCERNEPWFRIEVADANGKRAWTRAYFLDEIR